MSKLTKATVIRREDYTLPTFLIHTVELEFDLVPERTLVRSTLHVQRNPQSSDVVADLKLAGEALKLLSLTVNACTHHALTVHDDGLILSNLPKEFELVIENVCYPADNTMLSGLYISNGHFFTQCEAEGFRRITYFLDRPDVMATYRVTLRADQSAYPVLLSNGNLLDSGTLPHGWHYAKWEDPFPKPSYLFALVAGTFVAREQRITTCYGKEKLLQIWVELHDLDKTSYALDSLVRAIYWDEYRFGRVLDLERFMIVAVRDLNMGAMENKGLNIFNAQYVLANAQTATDIDFANIESVIGHEYFHNWTGNRVTGRDWFQLSLKEGLTVFRDQEFSADMAGGSNNPEASAVKRINDVHVLRQMQFSEDAGPMAHPVRPESYVEINNFYTSTIYEKGAEIVRMYQTLCGRDGMRRGMDLYFERHDGKAVTCDDFRAAMADANHRDLAQFERWYSQGGTPRVAVRTAYNMVSRTFTLTLTQHYSGLPPHLVQTQNKPLPIPFSLGLIDAQGHDILLRLQGEPDKAHSATTRLLELIQIEQSFTFIDVAEKPLPSLLRNFSAPVIIEYDYTSDELAFLLAHDSDLFNRWEAGQRLSTRVFLLLAIRAQKNLPLELPAAFMASLSAVLCDESLSPAFRAKVLTLPSETYLAEQMDEVDPAAAYQARQFMRRKLADTLHRDWLAAYSVCGTPGTYDLNSIDVGKRALKNLALQYLTELNNPTEVLTLAQAQFDKANNMTDRVAALAALLALCSRIPTQAQDLAKAALDTFYHYYEGNALVIDKWFALLAKQHSSTGQRTLDVVRKLIQHPAFNLKNPNRVRSLIFGFCLANPNQFHLPDGSGYAFWVEQVIMLDSINPQIAARLTRLLEHWRKFVPALRTLMRAALEEVANNANSKDVREILDKALA
ncbi:aminopeptidase N [Candidatus Vallotia cooleyia]|uniref:aminopeptidase N n=1 Tax=Candidatus Vallotiella adelgis TaxID=1177211 RepID=UPI001D02B14F|nr:aminopeptidase N [Candidatus Vallotia cooleyia]UDG82082.1 Aminopeptidase N [Candidatus Vallotia cooleyia]